MGHKVAVLEMLSRLLDPIALPTRAQAQHQNLHIITLGDHYAGNS